MVQIENWFSEIYNDLKSNNKKFVLIGGASCSGKGTATKQLKKFLESKGAKVLYIEADKYYKSMSTVLVEKALKKEQFKKYTEIKSMDFKSLIAEKLKSVIGEYKIDDKFSNANIYLIRNSLSKYFTPEDLDLFILEIKNICENYNFDEPAVVDLELLAQHINALEKGNTINMPFYSMNNSETSPSSEYYNGSEYDYVLIEGLYALRPEVLENINTSQIVTASIIADTKTLFSRRLYRDIYTSRVGSTPERTIISALKDVLPAYYEHIEPTLSKATYPLSNPITKQEIDKRNGVKQTKYQLNTSHKTFLKRIAQEKIINQTKQADIYFRDNNLENPITLCLRIEDGQASEICFKIGNNLSNRKVESYDLKTIFSEENKNANKLIEMFLNSGFEKQHTIYKLRKQVLLEGIHGDDVILNVDFGAQIGFVLEFVNASVEDEIYWANYLDLVPAKKNQSIEMIFEETINKNPTNLNRYDEKFSDFIGN
ncbi:MAG: hypothetical protein IJX26_03630 [Clostridia bacterium]|nr:hypothetical protein [Clostridia bacterium]